MRISSTTTIFAALALVATPIHACLRAEGTIYNEPYVGRSIGASVTDNGLVVCQDGSRIDQDGHFSLSCLPGYVYAVTVNGAMAWYSNGINSFSWTQSVSTDEDCVGACDDKNGACVCALDYSWDQKMFC